VNSGAAPWGHGAASPWPARAARATRGGADATPGDEALSGGGDEGAPSGDTLSVNKRSEGVVHCGNRARLEPGGSAASCAAAAAALDTPARDGDRRKGPHGAHAHGAGAASAAVSPEAGAARLGAAVEVAWEGNVPHAEVDRVIVHVTTAHKPAPLPRPRGGGDGGGSGNCSPAGASERVATPPGGYGDSSDDGCDGAFPQVCPKAMVTPSAPLRPALASSTAPFTARRPAASVPPQAASTRAGAGGAAGGFGFRTSAGDTGCGHKRPVASLAGDPSPDGKAPPAKAARSFRLGASVGTEPPPTPVAGGGALPVKPATNASSKAVLGGIGGGIAFSFSSASGSGKDTLARASQAKGSCLAVL